VRDEGRSRGIYAAGDLPAAGLAIGCLHVSNEGKQMEKLQQQLELIRRGTAEIFPEEELIAKLERAIETGKPLRVKLGIDPSTKDIHLGHTVVLHKLRQFQELGHKAVLIIGDGTGLVGDPSGRDKTRPQLTPEEIEENAKTYLEQVGKVLMRDEGRGKREEEISLPSPLTPHPLLEIVRNGDWFRKMTFFDFVRLASKITVARVLERDDFAERFKKKVPISLHELIYPVMQGYDSVMVKSDIELGGTDQKYNLLVGRDLQRDEGQEPQVCITVPLLIGTDGKQKMSKSYDNYIGVTEPAKTMFDKIVSIPDSLMRDYFILLTDFPMQEVDRFLRNLEPLYAKRQFLAPNILSRYYPPDIVNAVFHRHYGTTILESPIGDRIAQTAVISAAELKDGKIWIVRLVKATGFVKSNSEARQKIIEGAVTLNGEKITDPDAELSVKEGDIVKVGKKRLAVVKIETADKHG
jgi:tyrosyl-tRNA synthetase